MGEQSVIGVYPTMADAEAAIHALDEGGYPINQISIAAQDLESERDIHGFITPGDVAETGAVTGGWAGGLFGLLVGAAFLWLPGVGPLVVAGPLAAVLIGAIEGGALGAAVGGLLGALAGWGVSPEHVRAYEERLLGGKYLVIANGSAEEVARAHRLLQAHGQTADLLVHGGATAAASPGMARGGSAGPRVDGLRARNTEDAA